MHLALVLGLGAQLALGHYNKSSEYNSSEPYPSHSAYPSSHKHNAQPLLVGEFRLLGCVASKEGFPYLKKVASSEYMNLDLCAASCPAKFFGAYDT